MADEYRGFLWLQGVPGPSKNPEHPGWIPIVSWTSRAKWKSGGSSQRFTPQGRDATDRIEGMYIDVVMPLHATTVSLHKLAERGDSVRGRLHVVHSGVTTIDLTIEEGHVETIQTGGGHNLLRVTFLVERWRIGGPDAVTLAIGGLASTGGKALRGFVRAL